MSPRVFRQTNQPTVSETATSAAPPNWVVSTASLPSVDTLSAGTWSSSSRANQVTASRGSCQYDYCVFLGRDFSVVVPKNAFTLLHNGIQRGTSVAVRVASDFDPFRRPCEMDLSLDARRMLNSPNAGGNSLDSEVLSFELFSRVFGARLDKTEMEIRYWPRGGSLTDYTCNISGVTVGVSVTRAMNFKGAFEEEDAHRLLTKKLTGVTAANRCSLEGWSKQILHVWATSNAVAETVARVWETQLDAVVKGNTVVLVTVARRAKWLFSNSKGANQWTMS